MGKTGGRNSVVIPEEELLSDQNLQRLQQKHLKLKEYAAACGVTERIAALHRDGKRKQKKKAAEKRFLLLKKRV